MLFQNLARFPEIGSNSYRLAFGGTNVVLDAGTHPKHTGRDTLPLFGRLGQDTVDAILISHPHLDHVGGLPVLMREQPAAAVAMTPPTKDCAAALLHNSVNVMKSQKRELDEPAYPLYRHREVDECERLWYTREFNETFSIGHDDRVEVEFFRAGHVLGAAGIRMEWNGKTVFYTGDVHFEDQTLTRAADFPVEDFDTVIVETTRGDHPRRPDYTRESEKLRLGAAIAETIAGGGTVLIPVFAFGKTQELLAMLAELREQDAIPHVPVHIGGLSTKMSTIADRYSSYGNRGHAGFQFLEDFEDLNILPRGRAEPEFHPGHIYALSSGMMSEHTVSHRFARRILASDQHALLFVGYADSETPGGRILAAGQGGRARLDGNSEHETPVRCRVEKFDFSGHAPREQIADYVVECAPRNVVLVHGDPAAKEWFRQEIADRLPNSRVVVPQPGEQLDL